MENNTGISQETISEIIESLDPEKFVLTAEVIGDLIATELPFNTANAISNWFNLMGQAMETYAVQQENVAEFIGEAGATESMDYSAEIQELKCTMNDILKQLKEFNNQLVEVKNDIKILKEKN